MDWNRFRSRWLELKASEIQVIVYEWWDVVKSVIRELNVVEETEPGYSDGLIQSTWSVI